MFVDKEKIKVWSIAVPKNEDAIKKGIADEAAKKRANNILRDLKKGKDFSELAKKESLDSHAQDGGLIGYVAKGDMIPVIDEVLFSLPENQFSDIVETEKAYHIFKVGDHHNEKTMSLDESRDKISDLLYRKKAEERFQAWMEELKKTAFISIR